MAPLLYLYEDWHSGVLISDTNNREYSWREAYLLEGSRIQTKQEVGGSKQEQLVIEGPHLVQCTKIPDEPMDQESSAASKRKRDPW